MNRPDKSLLNMRNIVSKDVLNELMKDYFVTHLISDDSDSSEFRL